MKIIDGLKLKGKPAEIPDCNRDDLPEFFVEMGFKVGVEIGAYKGEYTEKLCKAGLKIYAIDPWRSYPDFRSPRMQKRLDFLYEHTKRTLASYDNCEIIRKTSMEAAQDFKDESIDFVYIDGHHGFKYVAEDLWEWTKKIRKGGIISGHDYAINVHQEIGDPWVLHVPYVITAWTNAFKIRNWYVVGRYESYKGEKRDTFRSWFWIKK